jgi:hypothetical protein
MPAGVGVADSGTKEEARCFLFKRSSALSSAVVVVEGAVAVVEALAAVFDCGWKRKKGRGGSGRAVVGESGGESTSFVL